MTESRLVLGVLGTNLRVNAPARWLELARELWDPFVLDDSGQNEALDVHWESDGWSYRFPEEEKVKGLGPWSCFIRVRAELGPWAVKRNADLFALHGALVARQGTSVLIAGEGGSGKSSTALTLCSQDWEYGGDDFAPMSVSTGLITPFPAPAALVDLGLSDKLSRGWVPPKWAESDELVAYLVPPDGMSLVLEPTLPSLLVFVRFSTQRPSGLQSLSKGSALSELAREALCLTPRAMSTIAHLVDTAPACTLTFSSLSQVPALFDSALR